MIHTPIFNMLKQYQNVTISNLLNRTNEVIFEILNKENQKTVYKLFYEQKKLNSVLPIFEKINVFLLELFLPYGVTIKQIFFYKIYLEYL